LHSTDSRASWGVAVPPWKATELPGARTEVIEEVATGYWLGLSCLQAMQWPGEVK
jgi:hypothetical protein